MATSGDILLATREDFYMATDTTAILLSETPPEKIFHERSAQQADHPYNRR